ncbi:hypothetical protein DPX16_3297 [Anabarilius grahami]|uniref:Uncharacterized protein n=1 Tax=Anabarilius grahami TaxID=495550 RepID=A0A3N0XL87_ANAGA|nr:hypothetical protein DPX16_3297 [Anabarilius grahami]
MRLRLISRVPLTEPHPSALCAEMCRRDAPLLSGSHGPVNPTLSASGCGERQLEAYESDTRDDRRQYSSGTRLKVSETLSASGCGERQLEAYESDTRDDRRQYSSGTRLKVSEVLSVFLLSRLSEHFVINCRGILLCLT